MVTQPMGRMSPGLADVGGFLPPVAHRVGPSVPGWVCFWWLLISFEAMSLVQKPTVTLEGPSDPHPRGDGSLAEKGLNNSGVKGPGI